MDVLSLKLWSTSNEGMVHASAAFGVEEYIQYTALTNDNKSKLFDTQEVRKLVRKVTHWKMEYN